MIKRPFVRGMMLILIGLFLGIASTLLIEGMDHKKTEPGSTGIVKTDTVSLDKLSIAQKNLSDSKISRTEIIREAGGVYSEYLKYITSPPLVTKQDFNSIEFNIYKNKYKVPLNYPKLWVGLGYGYPWGVRISAGYRIKNRLMIFTVLSKESVSLSTALYL